MPAGMIDRARPKSADEKQLCFLKSTWDCYKRGHVFLASRDPKTGHWQEHRFEVGRFEQTIRQILREFPSGDYDQYFCPNAFKEPQRRADLAMRTPYAWCDIDGGDPAAFRPTPSVIIQTSPGRTQGLWRFGSKVSAVKAEAVSKHLTYTYGGDRNGWSATKYLRLPYGINHKPQYRRPRIRILRQRLDAIASWPEPSHGGRTPPLSSTSFDPLRFNPSEVAKRYRKKVGGDRYHLMTDTRLISRDRSRCVFMIVAALAEAGATGDEIASVLWASPYFISKYGPSRSKLNEELSRILSKTGDGR